MKKEAQKTLKQIVANDSCSTLTGGIEVSDDVVADLIEFFEELGYRKLPKDKPPLLKYQSNHKVIVGSNEWHMIDGYNLGAEAQREADIKFYN